VLKDLKLAFCSAAIASASFSQPGAFGYGAIVAIAAALLSALGRAIWRSLLQAGHGRRDVPAARRHSERTFNPLLLLAASNLALPNKTSTSQEHRHVQP
jgi:hypothetical protein